MQPSPSAETVKLPSVRVRMRRSCPPVRPPNRSPGPGVDPNLVVCKVRQALLRVPLLFDRSSMITTVRPLAALALSLSAALALSACGGSADAGSAGGENAEGSEVTVTHAQGETRVPVDPETVVVFDVGVLSTLDSLGVDVAGVPDAVLPEALAQYGGDEYPKVGSLFEPDYEAVNALEPDLIIVAGRSAAVYPELAEIAPPSTSPWTAAISFPPSRSAPPHSPRSSG